MIYILGRQPAIGLAELESLYGSQHLKPVGNYAALVQSDDAVDFARIGGALKAAKVIRTIKTNDITDIKKELQEVVINYISTLPEGKFKLGLAPMDSQ